MDGKKNNFTEKIKVWRWPAGALAGALLLAAAFWLGRPAYRLHQEKHALGQAQNFMARQDYRSASLAARQALALDPTNVPACRIMAALADLARSPAVLDWQRRIVETEPTVANKLNLAAAGLRYENPPFPLAAQILADLAPTATNLAAYHLLAANLALDTRRQAAAETELAAAAQLEPTNRLYALNLAVIRLGGTNGTKAAAARAALEQLRGDATLGPPALRALIADRLAQHDAAAAENYAAELLAGAAATRADQLQELEILRALKRADFAARLQAVQHAAATNAPAIAEVAAWLQANGLLAEDFAWLTNLPARLSVQPPVRLALANAWLQSGDWLKLRDFAALGNWQEIEFLRLALAAHAWAELGVAPVAESNWGAAVTAAGNRLASLATLLNLAQQWQMPREQEKLLRFIVQQFPHERWAQQALERLYFNTGNTAGLQQLYARLAARFPADASFKNNLTATCLLLKTNVPQAGRWAAEAYAGNTNDPVIASTYAFALHLQNQTRAGLAVLEKLGRAQLQQPATALYYAVLLAATGATNEAAPYIRIARTDPNWLPEEKKLLAAAGGLQPGF